jgi:hypothetical protein
MPRIPCFKSGKFAIELVISEAFPEEGHVLLRSTTRDHPVYTCQDDPDVTSPNSSAMQRKRFGMLKSLIMEPTIYNNVIE